MARSADGGVQDKPPALGLPGHWLPFPDVTHNQVVRTPCSSGSKHYCLKAELLVLGVLAVSDVLIKPRGVFPASHCPAPLGQLTRNTGFYKSP